jgi:hypothetical protein
VAVVDHDQLMMKTTTLINHVSWQPEFEKTSSTYWMPWFWHLFHELVQTQPGVEVLFYLYLAHRFVVEQGQSVLLACWTWME